jgi:hypothetical protein
VASRQAVRPVIAQLPNGYRIEIGDDIEKATKASTARCLLSPFLSFTATLALPTINH